MTTSLLKRKRSNSHNKRVSFSLMDPLNDMPDIGPSNDMVGDLFELMNIDNNMIDGLDDLNVKTESNLGAFGFGGLDELGDISDLLQGDPEPDSLLDSGIDWAEDLGLGEIKSDLMWSSTLDNKDDSMNQGHHQGRRGRRRDVSVTLSECAEGFLALKDMELTTENSFQNLSPTLGNSFTFIDTPMATSESDTETGNSTDEEEIDVVNEDVGSSRTRVHRPKSQNRPQQSFEAGRSLLRNNRNKGQTLLKNAKQQQPQVIDHMNGDHSYFLVRPKQEEEDSYDEVKNNRSMTPSESSDDDSMYRSSAVTSPYNTLTNPESIDKRKIAAAVQNLIKNSSASNSKDVKFRFKMRFRSNSPARAHQFINQHHYNEPKPQQKSLLIQSRQSSHPYASALAAASNDRLRRKSATKNSHCPPPSTVVAATAHHQVTPFQGATTTTRSVKIEAHRLESNFNLSMSSPKKSALSKSKNLSNEDKCREIRDLHNRMERQRRVDLKNNYDQLKERVPSLQDVDKASKLNILNRAADYCRLLVSNEIKHKKELEKETQRNLILKRRFNALMSQLDNGTRLSSGRLSVTKRFE